jgi:membrane associated rhomboid family serine protease
MSASSSLHRTPGTWLRAGIIAIGFVALLWVLELVDTAADHRLDGLGVQPRDDDGLRGIVFAPVLHHGWEHLGANTLPVLVLGFLVLASGIGRGLAATAIIWVVGGVGTWLVAPTYTMHLGASVLVFGWLVYLVLRGFFARRAGEIVIGVLLLVGYGSLLWGLLPGQPGISWQGHLFGAIGGGIAAWSLRGHTRRDARSRP